MLNIRQVKHLLGVLRTTSAEVAEVMRNAEAFYDELLLLDPNKPTKARTVVNVTGLMRSFQDRLYRNLLLPKLTPSPYSHGGVRRRSIKTNAAAHIGSTYAFTADISDFYPSIHHGRVYRLLTMLGCSPDVARICTRLCTFRNHLALGLVTSPILADRVLRRVDERIGGACSSMGLVYTRYVDDITVSGSFDLESSGISNLVQRILSADGFVANAGKHKFGRLDDGLPITSLRQVRGKLDVQRDYLNELLRQLDDAAKLASSGVIDGPYYTRQQIQGRIRFVCWVNPGRRRDLVRRFRSIRWNLVRQNAIANGYQVSKKKLVAMELSVNDTN